MLAGAEGPGCLAGVPRRFRQNTGPSTPLAKNRQTPLRMTMCLSSHELHRACRSRRTWASSRSAAALQAKHRSFDSVWRKPPISAQDDNVFVEPGAPSCLPEPKNLGVFPECRGASGETQVLRLRLAKNRQTPLRMTMCLLSPDRVDTSFPNPPFGGVSSGPTVRE